jgi:hypothetical protein
MWLNGFQLGSALIAGRVFQRSRGLAPENEVAHSLEFDGPAMPDHDLAQGSPGPGVLAPIDRRRP